MTNLDLDFTSLTFHDNYVVGCTNEGVTIDMPKHKRAISTIKQHLDGEFGIILDEKYPYDIDFAVMMEIAKETQFVAGAIVTHRPTTRAIFNLFTPFFKRPVRFFSSLDEAKIWMEKYLSENKS